MRFILLIMFLMMCFIDSNLTFLWIWVGFLGGIEHSFQGKILIFGRMGEIVVFQARFATFKVLNLIIEVSSTSRWEIQRVLSIS